MSLTVHEVNEVSEGDGVDVKRLFPVPGRMNHDPFVLWDHFEIGAGRGFPDHPHRGFEAITYMFSGGMNHKDNLGNESFVTAGGAQRFTAGSGMVHSEMPAERGSSNGIQLWINLPKRLKRIQPSYQQVDSELFPLHKLDGVSVTRIVGEGSPLALNTEVEYQHIKLEKGAEFAASITPGLRGLIYMVDGDLQVNQVEVTAKQALFIEEEAELVMHAVEAAEFMYCIGRPHGEPIHQHGPFVD